VEAMSGDFRQTFRKTILNSDDFVHATFTGRHQDDRLKWHKVTLRPVQIKKVRHVQFSYFGEDKNITKNYAGTEIVAPLDQLLALPFRNLQLLRAGEKVRVQISKRGKAIIHRDRDVQQKPINLEHDRKKSYLLPEGGSDPFLYAIGITTEDGKVKAKMQRKFRQINQFLKLVDDTVQFELPLEHPIRVVDFGCGSAHLTFAIYHYFSHVLGLSTELVGVDIKRQLLEDHSQLVRSLKWEGISFQATRIIDYEPAFSPDIVLALHACDTATDEALAQGIKSGSRFIFSVPCCHHHLQQQLSRLTPPSQFYAIMRHGILGERMGDILTDAFRALILQMMGYTTDVVEFVSVEHTPRNLMLRATRSNRQADPRFAREYEEMKDFWEVTPFLEHLMSKDLTSIRQPEQFDVTEGALTT